MYSIETNEKFTIMPSVIVIYQDDLSPVLFFREKDVGPELLCASFVPYSTQHFFYHRRRLFMQNMTYNNIIFLHLTYYPVACFPLCMCSVSSSLLLLHYRLVYGMCITYNMASCHSFIYPACLPNKRTNTKLKQKNCYTARHVRHAFKCPFSGIEGIIRKLPIRKIRFDMGRGISRILEVPKSYAYWV